MTDQSLTPIPLDIHLLLEAILFVASGPVTPAHLASALEMPVEQIEQGLKELGDQYEAQRGLRLQWHGGRVQLTTAPETAPVLEKFLGLELTSRLSKAALETLAVIAYQQPVTRPQLDSIRGVSSDGVLRSLLNKGLVQEIGRADAPGRPMLFGTTAEFLQYFGLSSLQELPALDLESEGSAEKSNGIKILKD